MTQANYDEWAHSMVIGYARYLIGGIMITWSGRILRNMKELKYYGWLQIGENNNLFYSSHSTFKRGVPPGRYRIWANENKGVFINPISAYMVFPGV